MPPITTKETQHRRIPPASYSPFGPTYNPQLKYHGSVRLQTPDSTILNHNFSVPLHSVPGPAINKPSISIPQPVPAVKPSIPAINKPSIPQPKTQAYYAIKSTPQDPAPPLLPLAIREELWAIWKSDPRVPTVASRRAWAASRGVSYVRVDQWFSARKSKAKKAGEMISNDSYVLEVVPVDIGVKRQFLSPSPSFEDYTDVDLMSDDTLVSFGDCGSDVSYTSSRSSGTALSATPEPTQGNPYLRHEATNSELVSRTRAEETNGKQDASYSKDLHRYALLKRVWCLSDAYTHITTAY
jgi:hypothetical protein